MLRMQHQILRRLFLNNSDHVDMHNVCMRLLSMREHSRLELCNKLKVKSFAQDEIQEVLDGLVNEGWQSDQRFAESFIRQRIHKGYGPILI